jgi:hypothetical protein
MVFPTVQFAIFFPIALGLSWALMSRPALWKPFMLVASYAFYGAAGWRFCLLLAGVTLGNQAAAILMQRAGEDDATVTVRYSRRGIELEVTGNAAVYSDHEAEVRLLGTRERIALFGGELHAGRRRGGGWGVRARLPLPEGQA